jgi:hypothetical protein
MIKLDHYVTDTLLRDLVGHDRRPASFLVYLWLAGEEQNRGTKVQASYAEIAESIGISKTSAQAAIAWLAGRKLIAVKKATVTATPIYQVKTPWRR